MNTCGVQYPVQHSCSAGVDADQQLYRACNLQLQRNIYAGVETFVWQHSADDIVDHWKRTSMML